MEPRKSRILAQLRNGDFSTILKINLSDPRVIEIAGLSGVDAVWLCQEHVPNDWIGLEGQIRAARLYNMDTVIRVSRGGYSDYIRPFEADATGILVPHVANEEEARQIVEWTRFYPLGKRALDGGNTDGQFCNLYTDDYIRHSNTERLIAFQIESPEALENVEQIAAVPGFDLLVFGPGDFSHRIGKAGKIDAPEVVAARKKVAAVARRHGKFAMAAGLMAPFPDLVAEGHQLFGVGADVLGLGSYVKQRVEIIQQHVAALKRDPQASASTRHD